MHLSGGHISTYLEGKSHRGSETRRTQETLEWMYSYISNFADKMPHEEKLKLPSCLTMCSLYKLCKESLEAQDLKAVSESHFYLLWKIHFIKVSIQKVTYVHPEGHDVKLIRTVE